MRWHKTYFFLSRLCEALMVSIDQIVQTLELQSWSQILVHRVCLNFLCKQFLPHCLKASFIYNVFFFTGPPFKSVRLHRKSHRKKSVVISYKNTARSDKPIMFKRLAIYTELTYVLFTILLLYLCISTPSLFWPNWKAVGSFKVAPNERGSSFHSLNLHFLSTNICQIFEILKEPIYMLMSMMKNVLIFGLN